MDQRPLADAGKTGKSELNVSLLVRNAEDIPDAEVDALPSIQELKARIAERNAARRPAAALAEEFEQRVKKLDVKAAECRKAIANAKVQLPALMADVLLEEPGAAEKLHAHERQLTEYQAFVEMYEVAQARLNFMVQAKFQGSQSIGGSILRLEEKLDEERRAEKMRLARAKAEGTQQRR